MFTLLYLRFYSFDDALCCPINTSFGLSFMYPLYISMAQLRFFTVRVIYHTPKVVYSSTRKFESKLSHWHHCKYRPRPQCGWKYFIFEEAGNSKVWDYTNLIKLMDLVLFQCTSLWKYLWDLKKNIFLTTRELSS